MKEKPPLREGWGRAVKYSSPWHAEKCCILLILSEQGRYFFHDGSELSGGVPCWGGISFMEARWKWRWCPWSVSTGRGARGRWRRLTDNTLTTSTARLEAAAGPAGPGRASRRRAERSSRRGRRAGGQATRRPEIRRGTATPEIRRAAAHGAALPDKAHATPRNSSATQQAKPQKPNEKCPCKRQHSQLHSNMPKSHMRNMRAS